MKIVVVTQIGEFKFEEHFNSTADVYQAMCMFVSCNYRMLGDFHYKVKVNGVQATFEGINASADLYEFLGFNFDF